MSKSVPVKFSDVFGAFEYVSAGDGFENGAYICTVTGRVHFVPEESDLEEEKLPDGLEDSDDYVAVPHRRDLDLGSRLVFSSRKR